MVKHHTTLLQIFSKWSCRCKKKAFFEVYFFFCVISLQHLQYIWLVIWIGRVILHILVSSIGMAMLSNKSFIFIISKNCVLCPQVWWAVNISTWCLDNANKRVFGVCKHSAPAWWVWKHQNLVLLCNFVIFSFTMLNVPTGRTLHS